MSCLWIGVLNAFKVGTLPEFIYRFNGIFIRISIYLILGVKKLILKFLNNCKGFDITTNNNRNLDYYKQCSDEHWGTHVSFPSGFLSVHAQ